MSCKTNYSVKDAHEIATKQDDLCLSDQYASCNIPQDGAVLKGMNEKLQKNEAVYASQVNMSIATFHCDGVVLKGMNGMLNLAI
ncbi:17361_t:CDS:2 [Entrophospora sp. SA101]|nr:17361_t:CDS:2 [Entrophospora sp. SA101]